MRKRNQKKHSLEASTSPNSVNSLNQKQSNHLLNPKSIKLTESTGFHIQETGSFPETNRLWRERNQILTLERTRIVGKSKDNERIREYRPTQQGRKQIL